jgi:hypothetical protein
VLSATSSAASVALPYITSLASDHGRCGRLGAS